MKCFLLWWLHEASFGEYLVFAWGMYSTVIALLASAFALFFLLREWFETRPRRWK